MVRRPLDRSSHVSHQTASLRWLPTLVLGALLVPAPAGALCSDAIRFDCHQSGKSKLRLRTVADRLKLALLRGDVLDVAEFSDPTDATDYALCVYRGEGDDAELALELAAPAGSNWKRVKKGFVYVDKTATGSSDALRRLRLVAAPGKPPKIRAAARGPGVELPGVADPELLQLTAQVVSSDGACFGASVGVTLEDHPFYPNDLLTQSPEFLDQVASDYVRGRRAAGEPVDNVEFLSGYGPSRMFDMVYGGVPTTELPLDEMLWVLEYTGYFGGVWFRREMCEQGLQTFVCGQAANIPDEASFDGIVEAGRPGVETALAGSDAVVQQFNIDTLTPASFAGLAYLYGYNTGYLQAILVAPPPASVPPAGYLTGCDAGLFSCEYLRPTLPAVDALRPLQPIVEATSLGAQLLATQAGGVPTGEFIWSGPPFGFSVDHFTDEEYQRLLLVSSAFLELIQAPGLTSGANADGADPANGRLGALGQGMLSIYLGGYQVGLFDLRDGFTDPTVGDTRVLPSFRAPTPALRRK